jgi:hypothetical protein
MNPINLIDATIQQAKQYVDSLVTIPVYDPHTLCFTGRVETGILKNVKSLPNCACVVLEQHSMQHLFCIG